MKTNNFPLYSSSSEFWEGIELFLTQDDVTDEDIGFECLRMTLESRLDHSGGYPPDFDAWTLTEFIIVADLDPGKEYYAPTVDIYSKRKLAKVGNVVRRYLLKLQEQGRFRKSNDWSLLIWEYVEPLLEKCKHSRPYEEEPTDAEDSSDH